MNETVKNLENLVSLFDLSDFYAINMWSHENEVSMQGYFTDKNISLVNELGITLVLEDSFLRGTTTTDLGKVRIVLTTKQ
jgi:hypothetical protein